MKILALPNLLATAIVSLANGPLKCVSALASNCHQHHQRKLLSSSSSLPEFEAFKLFKGSNGHLAVVHDKMKPFSIDYAKMMQLRSSPRKELVCSAFGQENDVILDYTAGLGRDSLILAGGTNAKRIFMFEKNDVMHLLLDDALSRFRCEGHAMASKLNLQHLDSTDHPSVARAIHDVISNENIENPDELLKKVAVYIDPMYPEGEVGKRSLVKKETQILHSIVKHTAVPSTAVGGEVEVGENDALFHEICAMQTAAGQVVTGVNDVNTMKLLSSAWQVATTRVVVKRPLKAAPIGNIAAHSCMAGSRQRFDIYFKNRKLFVKADTRLID